VPASHWKRKDTIPLRLRRICREIFIL